MPNGSLLPSNEMVNITSEEREMLQFYIVQTYNSNKSCILLYTHIALTSQTLLHYMSNSDSYTNYGAYTTSLLVFTTPVAYTP
jgi:hypothetical protein